MHIIRFDAVTYTANGPYVLWHSFLDVAREVLPKLPHGLRFRFESLCFVMECLLVRN